METEKKFEITLTHYHWHCGEGCCSDSGYKASVEDLRPEREGRGITYENWDWEYNRDENYLLESAIEVIEEKIGRAITKEEYILIEDDEYSNDYKDWR